MAGIVAAVNDKVKRQKRGFSVVAFSGGFQWWLSGEVLPRSVSNNSIDACWVYAEYPGQVAIEEAPTGIQDPYGPNLVFGKLDGRAEGSGDRAPGRQAQGQAALGRPGAAGSDMLPGTRRLYFVYDGGVYAEVVSDS